MQRKAFVILFMAESFTITRSNGGCSRGRVSIDVKNVDRAIDLLRARLN